MKMVDGKMVPDDTPNTSNTEVVKETISKFNISNTNQDKTITDPNKISKTKPIIIKDPIKSKTKNPHAENLIKLLQNNFANSKERVQAENKIHKYFESKE